jgi:hypothetical protein
MKKQKRPRTKESENLCLFKKAMRLRIPGYPSRNRILVDVLHA